MSLSRLSKALLILITGLIVGTTSLQAVKSLTAPQYSSFEAGKPADPTMTQPTPADRLTISAAKADPGPTATIQPVTPVLVLRKENTLVFNEVVTERSVAKFLVKLQEMSNRLPLTQEIIVVLYTPGGEVDAGMQMIDYMKSIPQPIKTLTLFSASMGFQIVQGLGERMITPSGILMSHRAYGGLEGEIDGEFDVRLDAFKRQIEFMDNISARRMGLSLQQYKTLIRDEYWVHGFDSVTDKAADKIVLARCDSSLKGTEEKTFFTMFGPIKVVFSACPLITGPLEIKFDGLSLEGKPIGEKFMTMLYQNPKEFVRSYIKTQDFKKILRN